MQCDDSSKAASGETRWHLDYIATGNNATVSLAGSSYLGRLFGSFTDRAPATATYRATATNFSANYSSCRDNGKSVLCRSGAACAGD